MYFLDIKPYADKVFSKLANKNKKRLEIIHDKIKDIRNNPYHNYKFLRSPLNGFNRVHIDKHFVLIFRIIHEKQLVEVWTFEHHDEVYKGRWLAQ